MATKQKMILALVVFLAAVTTTARSRYVPQPIFLGAAQVDGRFDRDLIRITNAPGVIRTIQFRVDGGTVQFRRVVVHFRGGAREELAAPRVLRHGSWSRPIPLSARRGPIRAIELWYSNDRWPSRPQVSVYGYR